MTVHSSRQADLDDAAVAPIIGVILMVGITVTIGAVVWIVSANLTAKSQDNHIAPRIAFSRMASGVQVVSTPANPPVDWTADLRIGGTCWSNSHLMLDSAAWPPATGTKVVPGDVLGGCQQGETIVITHTPTNTVVYSYTF